MQNNLNHISTYENQVKTLSTYVRNKTPCYVCQATTHTNITY